MNDTGPVRLILYGSPTGPYCRNPAATMISPRTTRKKEGHLTCLRRRRPSDNEGAGEKSWLEVPKNGQSAALDPYSHLPLITNHESRHVAVEGSCAKASISWMVHLSENAIGDSGGWSRRIFRKLERRSRHVV